MDPIKIVARYADGGIIKGYTQNFLPNKPSFHLRRFDPSASADEVVEVLVKDLKAVFFVRDFAGDPNYQEQNNFPEGMKHQGKAVEVKFEDGEVIVGSTLSFDPHRAGFFVFPADPKSNNLRIFVVIQAVSEVYYI
jgi:hypothetical protein